jgi:hypothetical protein
LLRLREALDKALETNQTQATLSFCEDGEGFIIFIKPLEDFSKVMLPYFDTGYPMHGEDPFHTIGEEEYKRLYNNANQ